MNIKKNILSVILAGLLLSTTACKIDLPFIGEVDLEQAIDNSNHWSNEQLKAYSETALSILLNCDERDIKSPSSSTYVSINDASGTYVWNIDNWTYTVNITKNGNTVGIKEFGKEEPTKFVYNILITITGKDYPNYSEGFYFDLDRSYDAGTARIGLVGARVLEDGVLKAEYALMEGSKFEYLEYKSKSGIIERMLETNARPIDPNEQST